jgi:hypothetical protein
MTTAEGHRGRLRAAQIRYTQRIFASGNRHPSSPSAHQVTPRSDACICPRMTPSHSMGAGQPEIIEEPSGPRHQRLKDLYAYWLSKKGALIAPPRSAVRPEEIVAFLPNLALVDVIGNPPRFRFRLFGTELVRAYGQDLTGKFLDEIDLNSFNAEIIREVTRMIVERRPQSVRVRFTKQRDGRYLEYERLGLPLSEDGATVNMLFLGFVIERAFD